jgi:trehalose/maltose transport system substrate-binding protein
MRHWSSAFRAIAERSQTQTVGIALLPAGPSGRAQSVGGFHLAVSRYSAHPRQAAELVLFLTGMEVQTRRALRRGFVPTYSDLHRTTELAHALPQSHKLQQATEKSWVLRPSTVTGNKYAEASRAYYRSVHSILSKKVQAAAAFASLEQELKRLTNSRRGPNQN